MKKIILTVIFIMLMWNIGFCATGDTIGDYHYTDIVTYMYHAPITSYNIGGETMIDAEILNWHYGFDVYWYEDKRTLEITDKGGHFNSLQALSGEICESLKGTPGKLAGQYYYTDIKTYLNGKEIKSCNIGGRTCISAEDMANFGYNVIWNDRNRTLTILKPEDFYKYETDFGIVKSKYNYHTEERYTIYERGIRVGNEHGEKLYEIPVASNKIIQPRDIGGTYMKLSDFVQLLGGKCELKEKGVLTHSEFVSGISYDDVEYEYTVDITYDKIPDYEKKTEFEEHPQPKEMVKYPVHDSKNVELMGITYRLAPLGQYLTFDFKLVVNGEEIPITSTAGGKFYKDYIIGVEGELYIPVYTVAKILGYSYGG